MKPRVVSEKEKEIDKSLARLTKKKENPQINKIRNERIDITIDATEIRRIIGGYYEFFTNKLGNLEGKYKLLDTYNIFKT